MLAVAVAATLSACGSSDYNSSSQPQANPTPQFQGLADQSVAQDTTVGPLPFTISDDGGAASVMLTASSSDSGIVPADNIVIGGSGASRTLQITPAADAVGTATVTLRAADRAGYVSTATVRVQVNAVPASFLTTALAAFATDETGDPQPVAGRTFTADADDTTAFDALLE
jgi:hypothetical protein